MSSHAGLGRPYVVVVALLGCRFDGQGLERADQIWEPLVHGPQLLAVDHAHAVVRSGVVLLRDVAKVGVCSVVALL